MQASLGPPLRLSAAIGLGLVLLLAAGSPTLGHPTHSCVARAPGGCPNQHPVVRGMPVHLGAAELPAVQRTHKPVTITRETGSASPGLYAPLPIHHGGGKRRPHGIKVTKQTGAASPGLYLPN